jgi:hypothetical protein
LAQAPAGGYPPLEYPPAAEPQYAGGPGWGIEPALEGDESPAGGGANANASADNAGSFFGDPASDADADADADASDQDETLDELVPSPDDFELVEDDFEPDDAPDREEEVDEGELAPGDEDEDQDEDEAVPTLEDLVGPDVNLDEEGEYDKPAVQPTPMRKPPQRVQPQPQKSSGGPAGLLDYLASMAAALPPEKKKAFENSDVHLKLEYLRARLAGRAGLHRDAGKYIRVPKDKNGSPITPSRLRDTLQYIGQITRFHPDPAIANVLQARVSRVVQHLERERGSE